MIRVKIVTLSLAALVAVSLWGCGKSEIAPLPGWRSDFEAARDEAKKANKPLAVLFTAVWSDAASDFEKNTLSDPAVAKQLDRFVKVRLDLDKSRDIAVSLDVKDRAGNQAVPWLVLQSPSGERRAVPGQCDAKSLAEFLGTLSDWRELPGWLSDRQQAEQQAKSSGKPLAVLYSAAWETDAVAFEQEVLGDAKAKAALSAFTLVRLNFAASTAQAKKDGDQVKEDAKLARDNAKKAGVDLVDADVKLESAPVLLLKNSADKWVAVPGKCSVAALVTCIENLNGWKESAGWSSDLDAAMKRAQDEKKPMVLVLDVGSDWSSARLMGDLLESKKTVDVLAPLVKARIDAANMAKLQPKKFKDWAQGAAPCMILFTSIEKPPTTYHVNSQAGNFADKIESAGLQASGG